MMRRQLVLVPDELRDLIPAAFREKDAAKYVRMNINAFRKAVKSGVIIHRIRGAQRLYLKKDLDEYLEHLPVGNKDGRISSKPYNLKKGGNPCQ